MKDNKEVTALTKLTVNTDVLSWMDRSGKYVRKITGVDHSLLVYLLWENATVPVTANYLLPRKCYSDDHKSLGEEIVARKSHSSACVEVDKVALYSLLASALKGGPLESTLQPHEKTKDGQAVIKLMYVQYGWAQRGGRRRMNWWQQN